MGFEGNESLKLIKDSTLTIKNMEEWNKFVEWMKTNGYSGNKSMDNIRFSDDVLKTYKQQNSNFWIKSNADIKKIQTAIKGYRKYLIAMWKKGKKVINISGKELKPGVDDNRIDSFMVWAM